MSNDFRLTSPLHVPRITFAPVAAAPFGGAPARSPMAAPERTEKVEKFEKVEKIDRSDRDERVDKERAKAVELAVGQIEKQFGRGSIMRLGTL